MAVVAVESAVTCISSLTEHYNFILAQVATDSCDLMLGEFVKAIVPWESTSIQNFYFCCCIRHKVNGTKHASQMKTIQVTINERKAHLKRHGRALKIKVDGDQPGPDTLVGRIKNMKRENRTEMKKVSHGIQQTSSDWVHALPIFVVTLTRRVHTIYTGLTSPHSVSAVQTLRDAFFDFKLFSFFSRLVRFSFWGDMEEGLCGSKCGCEWDLTHHVHVAADHKRWTHLCPLRETRDCILIWLYKHGILLVSGSLHIFSADLTTNFISLSLRYVLYSLDNLLQILLLHKH